MIDDDQGFELLARLFLVIVPTLVALFATVAAARKWLRHRRLTAEGSRATAVVTGNQRESHDQGRLLFRPVVTYHTDTGREISTVLEELPHHREHLTGTEYPIAYDPSAPDRPIVARGITAELIALLAVALVFLAFAVLAYHFTR
ncbi:DUF3592 domain-containing protein [Actinoplanes sp. KI2]|uniref:DUF3592 domain-containing protein n=1 Tax=Actinoplanes sp. KI2 TaxID=2983315 RepID=UPI0021D60565|nr:DUF3592 domain-containing protein [Actinoplanes sp. KI2]MCU7727291.1 DUF3592 domain-containing protein [Actinoplanes sp. KI2]